jgi:hypothetical protein
MQNKEKERGDISNILLRKGRNNAWVLFFSKHGRKEDRKHAAPGVRRKGEWMLFCRIEERKKGGLIFNRLKERIEERRPFAE